jgi:hypothetical protein
VRTDQSSWGPKEDKGATFIWFAVREPPLPYQQIAISIAIDIAGRIEILTEPRLIPNPLPRRRGQQTSRGSSVDIDLALVCSSIIE